MILRILNPPHTDALAEIGPEALAIGSGMDCDLILIDPLLQPEHYMVRLLPGEGVITSKQSQLQDGSPTRWLIWKEATWISWNGGQKRHGLPTTGMTRFASSSEYSKKVGFDCRSSF